MTSNLKSRPFFLEYLKNFSFYTKQKTRNTRNHFAYSKPVETRFKNNQMELIVAFL